MNGPWTKGPKFSPGAVAITGGSIAGVAGPAWFEELITEPVNGPADTNENVLATATVAGGSMGANGAVRIHVVFTGDGSSGNKTLRIKFGGSTILAAAITTQQSAPYLVYIWNIGATNAQRGTPSGGLGGSSAALVSTIIDTTQDVAITASVQKATGSETAGVAFLGVEVLKTLA